MWPRVNLKKGKIEDMGFIVIRMNELICENPSTCIKEIVMLFASGENVSYDKDDVPLVVNYDTQFGLHSILFSTRQDLKYEIEIGNQFRTAKLTSNPTPIECNHSTLSVRKFVPEEKLTKMFKAVLDYVT